MSEAHDATPTTEPDILDDLDEMWPILAGAEGGRIYQPGEIQP